MKTVDHVPLGTIVWKPIGDGSDVIPPARSAQWWDRTTILLLNAQGTVRFGDVRYLDPEHPERQIDGMTQGKWTDFTHYAVIHRPDGKKGHTVEGVFPTNRLFPQD
jgi:hypothetical protein